MKLLIDTHVFLWFISGDERLPGTFIDSIADRENSVFLSVASFWEICIKYDIGKLTLPAPPTEYIPKTRQMHGIESLPITESSLFNLGSLPRLHRDPFDRVLISQALAEEMTLATLDQAIKNYNVPVLS